MTEENLINIVDNRHLFGIKEPKDIRRMINVASDILVAQKKDIPLSRSFPKIIEKFSQHHGDRSIYIDQKDKDNFFNILEKDYWRNDLTYQVNKENWLTISGACKRMGISNRQRGMVSNYAADRLEKEKNQRDLNNHVLKKKIIFSQKYPYLLSKEYLDDIKNDIFNDYDNWISVQATLKSIGFCKSRVSALVGYAKDRLVVQEENPELPVIVKNKKYQKNQVYPYSFSKRGLDTIQVEMLERDNNWATCNKFLRLTGITKAKLATQSKLKMAALYAEDRIRRQEKNPKLDTYVTRGKTKAHIKYPYLLSKERAEEIKEDMIKEGFLLLKKEKDDLSSEEILDVLDFKINRRNTKSLKIFLNDEYLKKSSIVYKTKILSNNKKCLCVKNSNVLKLQKLLIENKVDLKSKKNKDNTFKLVV